MLLEKLLWRSKPPHKQIFIVETSLVKRDELHISTILSTLLPMNYHHYRQDVEGVEQDIHLDHEVLFGYRKGHYGYNMASLAVVTTTMIMFHFNMAILIQKMKTILKLKMATVMVMKKTLMNMDTILIKHAKIMKQNLEDCKGWVQNIATRQ